MFFVVFCGKIASSYRLGCSWKQTAMLGVKQSSDKWTLADWSVSFDAHTFCHVFQRENVRAALMSTCTEWLALIFSASHSSAGCLGDSIWRRRSQRGPLMTWVINGPFLPVARHSKVGSYNIRIPLQCKIHTNQSLKFIIYAGNESSLAVSYAAR